jgi:hypothetical protein
VKVWDANITEDSLIHFDKGAYVSTDLSCTLFEKNKSALLKATCKYAFEQLTFINDKMSLRKRMS